MNSLAFTRVLEHVAASDSFGRLPPSQLFLNRVDLSNICPSGASR